MESLAFGKDPEVPNLAGQPAFYLEKSLIDYQTGKREDRRMTLMVKPLSKEEIRDICGLVFIHQGDGRAARRLDVVDTCFWRWCRISSAMQPQIMPMMR